ncbi:MAG: response regulator [Gemmatimonadota bacterium]
MSTLIPPERPVPSGTAPTVLRRLGVGAPAVGARARALPRVLCVDDDRHLLAGLELRLRRKFDVVTATSAADALASLDLASPFAVVISDMRMPNADGVTFLSAIRRVAPDTTRILLTGEATVSSAIAAVNRGSIFRILLKPIEAPDLIEVLNEAVAEHRERVRQQHMMEKALQYPLALFASALPAVAPALALQIARGRALSSVMMATAAPQHAWIADLTTTIVHVALAQLSPALARRWRTGDVLSRDQYDRVCHAMRDAITPLRAIHTAASVWSAVDSLLTVPEGDGGNAIRRPRTGAAGGSLPARAVRLALDFEARLGNGTALEQVLTELHAQASDEEKVLVDALAASQVRGAASCRKIPLSEVRLRERMQHDVHRADGVLLLPKGHEVNDRTLHLIQSLDAASRRVPVAVTPVTSTR